MQSPTSVRQLRRRQHEPPRSRIVRLRAPKRRRVWRAAPAPVPAGNFAIHRKLDRTAHDRCADIHRRDRDRSDSETKRHATGDLCNEATERSRENSRPDSVTNAKSFRGEPKIRQCHLSSNTWPQRAKGRWPRLHAPRNSGNPSHGKQLGEQWRSLYEKHAYLRRASKRCD